MNGMKISMLLALAATANIASAATVVEVNYSEHTAGSTISDGERIRDTSGNGYHGFWGSTSGNTNVVATLSGTGLDNASNTNVGFVFLRDGLTGIDAGWDGPTTTVTPYFNLDGSATGAWTMEAVVNWNGTTQATNGIMGQTGGNQIWIRERDGSLHYAIGAADAVNRFDGTIDVSAAKADSQYHHIAVVYDGAAGEVRTYLDGVLLDTNTDADIGTLPAAMLNNTGDFRLGSYNGGASDSFDGILDQFRISDTALTTAEFLTVPEPGSLALLGLGGLLVARRRRA